MKREITTENNKTVNEQDFENVTGGNFCDYGIIYEKENDGEPDEPTKQVTYIPD